MADKKKSGSDVPKDYRTVAGSERRPGQTARRLGPAHPDEVFSVTVVLRRRTDGPPPPGHDDFTPASALGRARLAPDDFAAKYGAAAADIDAVTKFAQRHYLKVDGAHAARRTVVLSGTVASMSKAFAVDLGRYEHEVQPSGRGRPKKESYRGRDGLIHVPKDLASIVVGVFGLDDRRITKRNSADPPNTTSLTTTQITALYDFPTNLATGQTIAILSEEGYLPTDMNLSFGGSPPSIVDVAVDASNAGYASGETTQDIVIAGSAAPGASLAVYFTTYSQQGWVDLISRVVHPDPGDPICSVMSSSYYVSNGDDAATLSSEGVSQSWINAVSMAFQDAALQGVTVCIASGDTGTDSKVGDGQAHVQYPASDPWVLSCGGTTIGNVSGSSFDEYVWNDDWGATGGGVSELFPRPSYQSQAGVPRSLSTGRVGRGVPDVAANSSPNAGYSGIYQNGEPITGNGTSASAPLWAGLVARLNAALGRNLGFLNPAIYAIRSAGFRDITGAAGPTDNGDNGVAGYPAGVGWDACTGWGSPDGAALLDAIASLGVRHREQELLIDPLALLLRHDIYVLLHTPDPPPIALMEARAEELARTLTGAERRQALARAQGFAQYARVLERVLERG